MELETLGATDMTDDDVLDEVLAQTGEIEDSELIELSDAIDGEPDEVPDDEAYGVESVDELGGGTASEIFNALASLTNTGTDIATQQQQKQAAQAAAAAAQQALVAADTQDDLTANAIATASASLSDAAAVATAVPLVAANQSKQVASLTSDQQVQRVKNLQLDVKNAQAQYASVGSSFDKAKLGALQMILDAAQKALSPLQSLSSALPDTRGWSTGEKVGAGVGAGALVVAVVLVLKHLIGG